LILASLALLPDRLAPRLSLGFVVAIITYCTGRTNLLSGIVHLVLLATYVFIVFAP